MRPAEVDQLIGDASKAREVLGWKPKVVLPRAGRDDGRRRPRGHPTGLVTGDHGRFVTGISGQDGSYLAERLLAEGVEVHALALESGAAARPPRRRAVHARRPHRRRRRSARCCSTWPRTRSTTSPRSARSRSRGSEPDLAARVNGVAAVALLESRAAAAAEARPRRALRPGLQRRDLRRARPHARRTRRRRSGRSTRTAPRRPTRTSMVDVYRRRDLHAVERGALQPRVAAAARARS